MALSVSLPQINLGVQERSEFRVGNPEIKNQGRTIVFLTQNDRKMGGKREVTIDTRTIIDHGEFNRFESQGVANNHRFDGGRRCGQSDHRFHNQGGPQGGLRNSAFRGQNDRNKYLNF
ncbi:hypothetical protein TNCV_42251 [Trichonephila clavipes]|nr:hypothetical protein TNCV_42251 [Trichonephila clavipes]